MRNQWIQSSQAKVEQKFFLEERREATLESDGHNSQLCFVSQKVNVMTGFAGFLVQVLCSLVGRRCAFVVRKTMAGRISGWILSILGQVMLMS